MIVFPFSARFKFFFEEIQSEFMEVIQFRNFRILQIKYHSLVTKHSDKEFSQGIID